VHGGRTSKVAHLAVPDQDGGTERSSALRTFLPEQRTEPFISFLEAANDRHTPAIRTAVLWEGRDMENLTREQIIHRAYELWEQAGKPDGRDQEFYHQAEQELRNADKASPLRTPDTL
jgi:hypothetical protein